VSADDVQYIRELYAAINSGRQRRAFELLHPEAELHQDVSQPDRDSYIGRDEFNRGYGLFMSAWEEFRYDIERAEQVGNCILLSLHLWGRGRGSGVETTTSIFHAWTMRDGKACRCFIATTREAALEAASEADR
jgi:ketosteroid isomerase-like protein